MHKPMMTEADAVRTLAVLRSILASQEQRAAETILPGSTHESREMNLVHYFAGKISAYEEIIGLC